MTQRYSSVRFLLLLGGAFLSISGCDPTNVAQLPPSLPWNFHILQDGRAYRSAQPTADELTAAIQTYGIRTVINLRGENSGKPWYDDEAAVCQDLGITLLNFSMSSQSLPSPDLLEQIIQALQTAEYPILIHCESGADRTGAISAIYCMLIEGQDRATAASQLSPEYFHFRQLKPCMDTLIDNYETDPQWITQYEAIWTTLTCTP